MAKLPKSPVPSEPPPAYAPVPEGSRTQQAVKATARAGLPAGYPPDLSRTSEPDSGSIGDGSHPIRNREAPWKRLGGGK